MASPWIIGGAAVAVAAGIYRWWSKKKAKTAPKPADTDAQSQALKKAYEDGCVEAAADAKADAGKVHNPRPSINHSDLPDVQQQYENGYNDCYESNWTAPPDKPEVIADSRPTSGGSKGMSASDYGCSRGRSSGLAFADSGGSGSDVKSTIAANLASDGSKKRQAESGDPAKYRESYTNCFAAAFASRMADKAAKDVLGGGDSTSGFGAASSPSGVRPLPFARRGFSGSWVGGVRGNRPGATAKSAPMDEPEADAVGGS